MVFGLPLAVKASKNGPVDRVRVLLMCPSAPAACRAGPGQWIRARVVCSPSLQRFAQGLDTGGIRRFFRGPCSISRRVRPFTQSLFPHAVDCARRLLVSLPCSNSRRAWIMEAYGKVCVASLCASPAAFRAGRVPSVFPRAPVAHVWRFCLCAHVSKNIFAIIITIIIAIAIVIIIVALVSVVFITAIIIRDDLVDC